MIETTLTENVRNKIYMIRKEKVMLDFDLALLYEVKTKALNQAVKRNIQRFPQDFMFQLDKHEEANLKSQIVTSNYGRRKPIFAFTEQGITMLSSVLKSDRAIYDGQFEILFKTIRQILTEEEKPRKRIGF